MSTDQAVDLDALEKLLAEATPGPWEVSEHGFIWGSSMQTINGQGYGGEVNAPDGDLIVAAVNNLPALIALARKGLAAPPEKPPVQPTEEVRRLREELERAEPVVTRAVSALGEAAVLLDDNDTDDDCVSAARECEQMEQSLRRTSEQLRAVLNGEKEERNG